MSYIHDMVDKRNIEIDNVGICRYKLPMTFESENKYNVISEIGAGVSLKSNIKGAHLSRIIKVLDEMIANKVITIYSLNYVLEELAKQLELGNANISLSFEIVYPKITPVSKRITYLNSGIILSGKLDNCKIEKSISQLQQIGV